MEIDAGSHQETVLKMQGARDLVWSRVRAPDCACLCEEFETKLLAFAHDVSRTLGFGDGFWQEDKTKKKTAASDGMATSCCCRCRKLIDQSAHCCASDLFSIAS
jgi:hypothetical protein